MRRALDTKTNSVTFTLRAFSFASTTVKLYYKMQFFQFEFERRILLALFQFGLLQKLCQVLTFFFQSFYIPLFFKRVACLLFEATQTINSQKIRESLFDPNAQVEKRKAWLHLCCSFPLKGIIHSREQTKGQNRKWIFCKQATHSFASLSYMCKNKAMIYNMDSFCFIS